MKKILLTLAVFSALALTSCGNSVEKDADKMGDLVCRMFSVMDKAMAGDESAKKEMEEIEKEGKKLSEELEKKYPKDSEDGKKFQDLMKTKIENCTKK